ncbi:MAG TPA: AraC family transcriptional regulator, partial [Anseongella sp.]|nr:AraC family transcriptional regulator [Anseongella sp.]
MKPLLKIIDTQQNEAFQIMKVNEPYFFPSWHFHPEYEIMLVQTGTGIRFVGDSMERFQAGDLVFYGSNIPHLYRSDKDYYQKKPGLISRATVVYFKEDCLGKSFWDLPGITAIKKLFALSKRGIKFRGKARNELKKLIQQLDARKDGIARVIDLLTILNIMVGTKEYDLLSSGAFIKYVDEEDCERMNKVYQFIMDNHIKNPSLEEVAKIAHMSVTAFCRYFKTHTNKTYTQFLNGPKISI